MKGAVGVEPGVSSKRNAVQLKRSAELLRGRLSSTGAAHRLLVLSIALNIENQRTSREGILPVKPIVVGS